MGLMIPILDILCGCVCGCGGWGATLVHEYEKTSFWIWTDLIRSKGEGGGEILRDSSSAESVFVNVQGANRNRFHRIACASLRSLGAGTSNAVVVPAHQAGNRFRGSLNCLQIQAQAEINQIIKKNT
jgi:hypothetical protein